MFLMIAHNLLSSIDVKDIDVKSIDEESHNLIILAGKAKQGSTRWYFTFIYNFQEHQSSNIFVSNKAQFLTACALRVVAD
jgi:hypothetical protein